MAPAVELLYQQMPEPRFRVNPRDGGLPNSWWTPKNEGKQVLAFDRCTQWFALPQEVLLPDKFS
jgi:hypothetical protein